MNNIDIIEINIDEFKDNIYNKYIKLFPEDEQRNWKKIEATYNKGIEKFYKIILDNKIIGFFMLEKLNNYPFYLDYFAIFKEYQHLGYGTKAIKMLIDKIGSISTINNKLLYSGIKPVFDTAPNI